MSVPIHPRKLTGPWAVGYALDLHTIRSTFRGYNEYGRPEFETERPPIGELLYRLKNHGDASAVEPLAKAAVAFIRLQGWRIDGIVPMPPSNTVRKRQPVIEVASEISRRTGLRLYTSWVRKVKNTGQLKDVFDREKREAILADAFAVDRGIAQGKSLLVFDDLFRSGATATALTRLLLDAGSADRVHLLTLTQTRKNL